MPLEDPMKIRTLRDVEGCTDLDEARLALEVWIGWPYFGASREHRLAMMNGLHRRIQELER
jgi:hypothetical protein